MADEPMIRESRSGHSGEVVVRIARGTVMSGIFISYRREDCAGWTGRLAGQLRGSFRADELFMDIHTIEPGMDFTEALSKRLRTCDVLLAVIGPHWLWAQDRAGRPRLQDPNDYVRLEIATALQRNIRVIPVLVGDTTMPTAADLPDGLGMLARRQAYELSDTRWDYDATQLLSTFETILGKPASRMPEPPQPATNADKPVSGKAIAGLVVLVFFFISLVPLNFYVGRPPYNPARGYAVLVYLCLMPSVAFIFGVLAIIDNLQNKATGWWLAIGVIGVRGIFIVVWIYKASQIL